ncbi:MAG: cadherin-like beta sandwich domain-containing protein [Clostridium sp.]|nr:cadherin-like beta sandwich domain-containing protein [Clostridium sp.]
MNKNIKRVIAMALTISAFSTFSSFLPGSASEVFVKPAYAASYDPENGELSSLKIKSSKGETLKLKEGYNGDTVKLSEDKEYYIKMTDGSEGLKVDAEAEGKNRVVKVFETDSSDEKGIDPGDEVLIGKGYSTIYIRTYKSSSAYRTAYKNKNVKDCEEEYVIRVMKTVSSSNEDTTQDSIFLDDLDLSKGDIDFFKGTTSYTVKLSSDAESVKITAKPEKSSYRVRIDGKLVTSEDDYKRAVDLNKGKNEIKVKVTDDKDNQRTYTLNIIRGKASDSDEDEIYLDDLELSEGDIDFDQEETEYTIDLDEDTKEIDITATPEDDDYLVTIDGEQVTAGDDYEKTVSLKKGENTVKVLVEDELNDLKRTYILTINRGDSSDNDDSDSDNSDNNSDSDSNSDDNSNVDSDINKDTTGWVQTDKGWQYKDKDGNILKSQWLFDENAKVYCYLNESGLRKTGWFKDNGIWYLLGDNGAMLTGWQKDNNAWYYLNSNGAMETGWHKEEKKASTTTDTEGTEKTESDADQVTWYYLNGSGAMLTGWFKYGQDWYYFNAGGEMQTGWIIDSGSKYYMNEDGSMQTESKTIDGKEYKFNKSGAVII